MAQADKRPMPPEDAYPELAEDETLSEGDLEALIAEATGETATAETAESAQELKQLREEVSVLKQQLQEREEAYVRLYAEFDNFRKRTQREKEELGSREKQKVLLEVLPCVDNFERAQKAIKVETEREKVIHESYQGVYRLLVESLKRLGISRLSAVGQPFDPNQHEAMMQQPSSEYPEGIVAAEFQAGYMLGDIILRHAMVTVSTGAPESSPEAPASETAPSSEGEG